MKRNNKGFTLIELLAVIVVLSIILTIATTAVLKTIKDSKEKAKYIAAKEIVDIAEAYFATHSEKTVSVEVLCNEYMENDATNPATGENINGCDEFRGQTISISTSPEQSDYKLTNGKYLFAGYEYSGIEQQNNSSSLEITSQTTSQTTSETQYEEPFMFMCCKGIKECKENEKYFNRREQFTCSTNKVGVEITLKSGTGLSSGFDRTIKTTSHDLTKQFMFDRAGEKKITARYNGKTKTIMVIIR